MRKLMAAVAAVAIGLTLSGCVVFRSAPSASAPVLGPVNLNATICASDTAGSFGGCTNATTFGGDGNGNSDTNASSSNAVQLLLGYRVPAGSVAPASFTNSGLVFTRNDSYTSELQRLKPAPPGFQWFGYMSASFNFQTGSSAKTLATSAPFGLPRRSGGAPYAGPFRYRVVVGGRFVGTETGPNAPVQCGASLFARNNDTFTICVDAPANGGGANQFDSHQSVQTSDLGIAADDEGKGGPDNTAGVPFTLRYAGDASTNFAISGATDLPGARVSPSQGSLSPAADSTNPVQANVRIPDGARPGRYKVTLVASLGADRTRSATGTLLVTPQTLRRIRSPIQKEWRVRGRRTKVVRLRVRDVPGGASVRVSCTRTTTVRRKGKRVRKQVKGRGCPFLRKRFSGSSVNIGSRFKKQLRSGTSIEIRITHERMIGKVVTYKTRNGKLPKTSSRCLPPGAKSPTRC